MAYERLPLAPSSAIASIEYDPEIRSLLVEFVMDGNVVEHSDVPQPVVDALRAAPSIGRFYNAMIRPNFPHHSMHGKNQRL